MTQMTVAELAPISYHHATRPAEVHDIIRQARANRPVALGPYGPEMLGYELVRAVLRDERFEVPRGMFLAAQGITSGPLWERANDTLVGLDGPAHLRLRRLVARAFIPKAAERLRTTCVDIVTELVARCAPAGRCDVVADLAVPYAVPVICALLGACSDGFRTTGHPAAIALTTLAAGMKLGPFHGVRIAAGPHGTL